MGRHPTPVQRPEPVSLPVRAARRDLYANAINEALIARPGTWLTRALVFFDNRGVDGAVNGAAALLGGSSGRLRRLQTGFVRSYALSMLGGSVLVVAGPADGAVHVNGVNGGNVLLLVLMLLPLVGALVLYPLRRNVQLAKQTAMGFALAEVVLVAVVWFAYSVPDAEAGVRFQLEFGLDWIPAFGTRFALGIDGVALVLLAMTAFLVPGLLLFSWEEKLPEGRTHSGYFALLLATEATLVGVFTATDVFLFYVFFEAMLVPMYFLIGRFGGPRRQYAAVKFFLYSLFGGLIMLASLIGLYVVSREQLGAGTFSWADLQRIAADVPESTQIWLFLGFFVAFAIKAPLVPFHTWLPDAGAEAPIGAGVVLVGVLDKVGTFGFLRYCLPLFPLASPAAGARWC